ncbi:MAG: hypothetical protein ACTSR3_01250 [Candidatus Helarchaeota archaeon]
MNEIANRKKLVDSIKLEIQQKIVEMILFGDSPKDRPLFQSYIDEKMDILSNSDLPQIYLDLAKRKKFETCWLIIEAIYRSLEMNNNGK